MYQGPQLALPNTSPPLEITQPRRPLIGYAGGVHQWVDQDLLVELARAHPNYSFVFVGPIQTNVERLRRLPNVALVGQKPHDRLPHCLQQFDVGIIPYRLTEYTRNVYPTKLNEYHALGKPVVSTPLQEILAFNQRYGPLVGVAADAQAFGDAIRAALHDSSPELIRRRKETARDNSWEHRMEAMQQLIREVLAQKVVLAAEDGVAQFRASWIRSRRALRWTAWGLLAWALLFQTPLVWLIAEPLRLPERLQSADAIVIFAGGVGESGQSGQGYQERVLRAVELYGQGLAPRMVVVSGYTWTFQEASIMRALAQDLQVPASAITTVTDVQNTRDYVLRVKSIAQREGWDSILLVTSPYHTRRAQRTFTRNVPNLEVFQAPVTASNFYAHTRGIRPRQLWALVHEVAALLYYRIKGWI